MNWAEFLTTEEIKRVHEASLVILEETGLLVRNEKARRIFARAGCRVESESGVVKIPGKVVEEYRKAFPPSFTFRGRDPRFDRTLPKDGPIMITASSAPDIIDPETGRQRRATSGDIARDRPSGQRTAGIRRLFHLDPGRRCAGGALQPDPVLRRITELRKTGAEQHAEHEGTPGRPGIGGDHRGR